MGPEVPVAPWSLQIIVPSSHAINTLSQSPLAVAPLADFLLDSEEIGCFTKTKGGYRRLPEAAQGFPAFTAWAQLIVSELGVLRQNHCDSDMDDEIDERSGLAELNKREDFLGQCTSAQRKR